MKRTKRLGKSVDDVVNHDCIKIALHDLPSGSPIKKISDAVKHNRHLREISISNSDITDEGIAIFVKALSGCKKLKRLEFANNKIGDRGAESLVDLVKGSPTIEVLDLSDNEIGVSGVKKLLEVLGNPKLEQLIITGNRITEIEVNLLQGVALQMGYNWTCVSIDSFNPQDEKSHVIIEIENEDFVDRPQGFDLSTTLGQEVMLKLNFDNESNDEEKLQLEKPTISYQQDSLPPISPVVSPKQSKTLPMTTAKTPLLSSDYFVEDYGVNIMGEDMLQQNNNEDSCCNCCVLM